MLRTLNHRDTAAEPAEHLAELQANVSAAKHDQVSGNCFQVHDIFIGQVWNRFQPRNCEFARTPAGIDEYFFGFQLHVSHNYFVSIRESSNPMIQMQIRPLLHLLLFSAAKHFDNSVLLGHDHRQIHAHIACAHSPALGIFRIVGNLRALDHRFRRRAASVDASAAEKTLFDERHLPSEVGKAT